MFAWATAPRLQGGAPASDAGVSEQVYRNITLLANEHTFSVLACPWVTSNQGNLIALSIVTQGNTAGNTMDLIPPRAFHPLPLHSNSQTSRTRVVPHCLSDRRIQADWCSLGRTFASPCHTLPSSHHTPPITGHHYEEKENRPKMGRGSLSDTRSDLRGQLALQKKHTASSGNHPGTCVKL